MYLKLVEHVASRWALSAGLPLMAVLLAACPSAVPSHSDPETEREPTFELEVGTGRDAFEEIDAEGTLVLEKGPQGLQHVYVSLRAPVTEGFHSVDIAIEAVERPLSAPTRVNAPFVMVPGQAFAEMVGQLVVVPNPEGFTDGRSATLRAHLETQSGDFGAAERVVHLRW
jgi:hypothetical protein